ncbi:hypothetical protein RRG08_039497 [Elysia crispata]|uniref:Uncharacterized protein n=1 Tax=Elysia crispata TaxID=231223 RepID=A0AAE1D0Q4_9GAST|nr:hypothetical protein RRG08_039497 [Elysia crispata]
MQARWRHLSFSQQSFVLGPAQTESNIPSALPDTRMCSNVRSFLYLHSNMTCHILQNRRSVYIILNERTKGIIRAVYQSTRVLLAWPLKPQLGVLRQLLDKHAGHTLLLGMTM